MCIRDSLYLIAALEEPLGVIRLYLKIVAVDAGAEANFLDFNDMLLFSCFLLALRLFETELAVVHHTANRRLSLLSDFYQVKILCSRCVHGLRNRYDADLIAVSVNQSDFLVSDILIDLMFQTANC